MRRAAEAVLPGAALRGEGARSQQFGRRTDVSGHSFAFMVEDTEEGPEFWHVPFGVDLKQIPREEREEFLARRTEEFERWLEEDQAT